MAGFTKNFVKREPTITLKSHNNNFQASCLHYCDVSMAACGLWPACVCVRACVCIYIYQAQAAKIQGNEWGPFGKPSQGRAWLCSLAPAGNPIYCPIGHQIWGPLGKQDVCPNFALTAAKFVFSIYIPSVLTAAKFVFSNSGNFRAKANPPKPRYCPKRPFGQ